MKLEVRAEVRDVYGGDGEVRMIEVEEKKLKRTKRTKTKKEGVSAPTGQDVSEEQTQTTERDVQTFRKDEQGRPILRLGGIHGKIWGAAREAAQQLRVIGVEPFSRSYKPIVAMLNFQPIWVPVEMNGGSIHETTLPQVLQGRGTMIIQRYDVIPKGEITFTAVFPDAMEHPVKLLLKQLEVMGLFNKRRATIKIIDMKEV